MQPLIAIPRPGKPPFGHHTACIDSHCALEKQPAKADHLSRAYFEYEIFMYHSVHGEKFDMLIWAIRLIFSVTVIYYIIVAPWLCLDTMASCKDICF